MANRIKFAVFDLDGTLTDSKWDIASAANFTRKHYGLEELTVDKISSFLGNGITALVASVLPEIEKTELEQANKIFKDYYSKHLLDKTVPFDGIIKTLDNLHKDGIRKVVLSNKTEIYSKDIICGLGMDKYFEYVYGGDSFCEKKPSPLPLNEIAGKYSVDKESIVMIGDGTNDILAGKNAGIKTIAVLYGYSSKERIEQLQPSYKAEKPENIAEIIRSIDKCFC